MSTGRLRSSLSLGAFLFAVGSGCGGKSVVREPADEKQDGSVTTGGTGGSATSTGGVPTGGVPTGGGTSTGGTLPTGGSDQPDAGEDPTDGGARDASVPEPSQPGDPCERRCSDGFECFRPPNGDDSGRCAPLCEDQEQSAWGKPCESAVNGGPGICRPFHQFNGVSGDAKGLCTGACDPLAQDCPEHFACDVTEDSAGTMPNRVFACLPVTVPEPFQEGDYCDGFPTGQCPPGLSCVAATGASWERATCHLLCDSRNGVPCAPTQTCELLDWFPLNTVVGVCVTP